jgi:cytochrome c peroxidase
MQKIFVITFLFLFSVSLQAQETPIGLPPVPAPQDNPQSADKVNLGKTLFEDKRFSADGSVSCATCHDPSKAFVDGLPLAEGIKKTQRNSQLADCD